MNDQISHYPQVQVLKPVDDPDIVGHIIQVNGGGMHWSEYFCKNFYSLNGFFCIEDAKVEDCVESTIDRVKKISFFPNENTFIVTRKNGSEISYSGNRQTYGYGRDVFCKTISINNFHSASSYKKDQVDFPLWTTISKSEAIEEANKLEEENNKYIEEKNTQIVENIYDGYKQWVADCVYARKSKLGKWLSASSEEWTKTWLLINDVDTTELDSKLEIFLASPTSKSIEIKFDDLKYLTKQNVQDK